jgi:hypothetical protein
MVIICGKFDSPDSDLIAQFTPVCNHKYKVNTKQLIYNCLYICARVRIMQSRSISLIPNSNTQQKREKNVYGTRSTMCTYNIVQWLYTIILNVSRTCYNISSAERPWFLSEIITEISCTFYSEYSCRETPLNRCEARCNECNSRNMHVVEHAVWKLCNT